METSLLPWLAALLACTAVSIAAPARWGFRDPKTCGKVAYTREHVRELKRVMGKHVESLSLAGDMSVYGKKIVRPAEPANLTAALDEFSAALRECFLKSQCSSARGREWETRAIVTNIDMGLEVLACDLRHGEAAGRRADEAALSSRIVDLEERYAADGNEFARSLIAYSLADHLQRTLEHIGC
ncbi:unnamed protein product [Lampetra planeri]